MNGFIQRFAINVRYASNIARRQSAITLICALTLAAMIALTTVVFAILDAVALQPLAFPEPNRLVAIVNQSSASTRHKLVSAQQWRQLRERSDCFEEVAAMRSSAALLRTSREVRQTVVREVSDNYFRALGLRAILGRTFAPAETNAAHPVVVSLHTWRNLLGGRTDAINRTLFLDRTAYTVIGVMPAQFQDARDAMLNSKLNIVWILSSFAADPTSPVKYDLNAIARLKPGVSFSSAARQTDLYGKIAANNTDLNPALLTLKEIVLGRQEQIIAFFIIALALLLTGCGSISAVLYLQWSERWKDLSMLSVLGAPRSNFLGLLLLEGLIIGVPGGCIGVVISGLLTRLFIWSDPVPIVRLQQVYFSDHVIAFGCGISLLCSILIMLSPSAAILGARFNIFSRRPQHINSPPLLTVWTAFHTAATVALLTSAVIAIRISHSANTIPLGFDVNRVSTFNIEAPALETGNAMAQVQELPDRLRLQPRIESVAFASSPPWGPGRFFGMEVGNSPGVLRIPHAQGRFVSEGYFETLRIPVLEGRSFTGAEAAHSTPLAVVSSSFAERYLGRTSLNRRVHLMSDPESLWRNVIGVVGDVRDLSVWGPPQPEIYLPYAAWLGRPAVVVRTDLTSPELHNVVSHELSNINSNGIVWGVRRIEASVSESLTFARVIASLLGLLALISVIAMSVSVYALCSVSAHQRKREITVRVALGVGPLRLMATILGQRVMVLAAGFTSGAALASFGRAWVEGLLHGVESTTSFTNLGIFALVAAIVLVTAYRRARLGAHVADQRTLFSE